jgi:two-component system phosphate regulon sensor histidine kinase PhoR
MKKLRASAILMIIAILGITGFQAYWLKTNHDREKQNLELKTNLAFRETILHLQASKLKLEGITLTMDSSFKRSMVVNAKKPGRKLFQKPMKQGQAPISVLNLIQERMRDSLKVDSSGKTYVVSVTNDTMRRVIIDSLRRVRAPHRFLTVTHKLDSVIHDGLETKEVQIEGTTRPRKRLVTINPGNHPATPGKPDTMENMQGDVVIESRVPVMNESDILINRPAPGGNGVFRLLYDIDSLSVKDSITIEEIDSLFRIRLNNENIDVGYRVSRLDSTGFASTGTVTIGFAKPTHYNLSLTSTMSYMLNKLSLPILFSLLLVGITITSFILLYRNLLRQQRLGELKNDFISNITHELKTPIATVGVAIEALKNFNAIDNPARTREYLDISQQELQRLNLLVDKVLKLSMFEKKEIDLKYEWVDLADLVSEVVASMRLQIEKYDARVIVRKEGDTMLNADRLHLLSVIFNLVDNALKYSKSKPEISITMTGSDDQLVLKVADNGIGIPAEYKGKVFEKFFRVPHGDTHNAKGYGLGLSYTAHVIRKHQGTVVLNSEPGQGTEFIFTLPKNIKS